MKHWSRCGTAYGVSFLFRDRYESVFAKVSPSLGECSCLVSITFKIAICHMLVCHWSGSQRKAFTLFSRLQCHPSRMLQFALMMGTWALVCLDTDRLAPDSEWITLPKAKDPLVFVILLPPFNWIRKIMAFKIKVFETISYPGMVKKPT